MSIKIIKYSAGGGGDVPADDIVDLVPNEIVYGAADTHVKQSNAFLCDVWLGADVPGAMSIVAELGSGNLPLLSIENYEAATVAAFYLYDNTNTGVVFSGSTAAGVFLSWEIDASGNVILSATDATSMQITPLGTTPSLDLGASGKPVNLLGNAVLQEGQRLNGRALAAIDTLTADDLWSYTTTDTVVTLPDADDARESFFCIYQNHSGTIQITPGPDDTINLEGVGAPLTVYGLFRTTVLYMPATGVNWQVSTIPAPITTTQPEGSISYQFVEGGAVLTAGVKVNLNVPFMCRIIGWKLVSTVAGDLEIDILRTDFGSYPVGLSSIVAATPPELVASDKNFDNTLTGWSVELDAEDILQFEIVGVPATVTNVTLSINYVRR